MRGDAVNPSALSSSINPTLSDGSSSHSHLPELIGDPSFVSAWDLYLEQVRRRLITVLTHQRKDARDHVPPCAMMCVVVCASPLRGEVLGNLSSNVANSVASR